MLYCSLDYYLFIAHAQKRQSERFSRPEKCKRDNVMRREQRVETRRHPRASRVSVRRDNQYTISSNMYSSKLSTVVSRDAVYRRNAGLSTWR